MPQHTRSVPEPSSLQAPSPRRMGVRPPQSPPQSLSQMSSGQRVSRKTGWPYHPFSGHAFLTPNSRSVSESCLQHTRRYPRPMLGPKPFRLSPPGCRSALCVPILLCPVCFQPGSQRELCKPQVRSRCHMLKTHQWLPANLGQNQHPSRSPQCPKLEPHHLPAVLCWLPQFPPPGPADI